MSYRSLISMTAVAAALAGCASGEPADDVDPPAVGRLVVLEDYKTDGPLFTEGSVPHLRIARQDGGVVFDDEVLDAGDGPLFDRNLPRGEYRLDSAQRPCDGNCGYLDPPTDECSGRVTVRPDTTTTVTITVRPGSPCRIAAKVR
jgi:hypothetical protein